MHYHQLVGTRPTTAPYVITNSNMMTKSTLKNIALVFVGILIGGAQIIQFTLVQSLIMLLVTLITKISFLFQYCGKT